MSPQGRLADYGLTQIEVAKATIHDAVDLDEIEHTDTGWYIWLIALTASIGGMLFGYDTGIISAVLVYLEDGLGHLLSASEKEMITSLCSAGAFVGSIIAGLTADRYGRKAPMYIGCALFTVGAILQATAYSVPQMAVGRFIVGFGVGSAAMIVPAYIAEIAPTKHRGRMIGLNNVSMTGRRVISYGLGAAFSSVPNGWRYMVGLGGVPSILLAVLLPLCPESPRQLVYHDKYEEAQAVLHRIFMTATPEQVQDKTILIEAGVRESRASTGNQTRWSILNQLHTNSAYFRALVCACGLMTISQMSGFNVLMYYSGMLFALVGFSNPVAVGLVVSGTILGMTLVNMLVVDSFGRRRLLITTAWGMSASLVAVAVSFAYIPVDLETLEVTTKSITTPAIIVLVFIIFFVLFYGVSIGNTAWMSADFFPMEVRAVGTMLGDDHTLLP
ncbi:hypothetical protein PENANT_c008G01844 [Penicillium antarcticum]|uniref:Major facilitator superfamily (MFS) profile domain-containing protein n=1 Tax=Penicillium antarcticum TaxID=416450 RepID=A0A1V6QA88_9EURO|nr:hypothetical protein PENANT_c008G01844 [Penicillium antarcticum]